MIQKLGRGEAETIQLYNSGRGDFIVTDDGAAAKLCKRGDIPFINALLFPVVLKYTETRPDDFCNRAFGMITDIGRYSDDVIDYASRCDKKEISFALP